MIVIFSGLTVIRVFNSRRSSSSMAINPRIVCTLSSLRFPNGPEALLSDAASQETLL
jgi:hypothetical protein